MYAELSDEANKVPVAANVFLAQLAARVSGAGERADELPEAE